MELNLEWVDAFVDFADHLNFTHAARARHLSQPALHMQVGKLQESVGAELYRRRGRALELTAAGQSLAAFGRELRQRREAFLAELRGERADAPVVLCAGEGAYLYLLGPAIRRFHQRRAGALHLLVRDGAATLAAVREGIAQVGVVALTELPTSIEAEPLAEVGQMLVLPRAHPLAGRARLRLADLQGVALIVPPPGRPHRRMIDAALGEAQVPWEVAVEASGWALMIRLCSLGVGLAIVNDVCHLPRDLVGVPLPQLPRITYLAIRRRAHAPSAAGAALWSLLVD